MRVHYLRRPFAAPAAALVGMALALTGCDQTTVAAPAAPPTPVRVETVKLEPASRVQRYAAVIRPRIEADIGFRVGGKVVERLVDVGAPVQAGTPLARLDPADLDARVRAAEAQRRSALALAANAKSEFARYAKLHAKGWATAQEYDKRRAAVETADAAIRELDAQLGIARDNARYATLIADGPGRVTSVLVEPGQVVSQGQTVFRIARAGELEVLANVPESQVGMLDQSDLTAELWSMPGISIKGRLRELAPSADAATRTYQARIALDAPPPGIQLGMTASLVVTTAGQGDVARLPMTALAKQDGKPAMWVLNAEGNGVALRPIGIGGYSGDRVTVLDGLEQGDRVVTAGVHKLYETQKVRVWTEPVR
ncbi:RND family efflux transporter MFP subunit [Skermanella aerolata]|nr:efflux RND transporter periplasmic adaptor subunit [Skermanella aerolata]KJB92409.1 multidrug transporter [Skermanella aerolata KACC 11604]